jgi:hypothetical protein
LADAKRTFKVIEKENSNYLIGTVQVNALRGNLQSQPHVFAREDGWIIAYFNKDESIGHVWPYTYGVKAPNDV